MSTTPKSSLIKALALALLWNTPVVAKEIDTIFDGTNSGNPQSKILLEYWNASDGSFTTNFGAFSETISSDTDWTSAEIQSVQRGMEYLWDVLGQEEPGRVVTIRAMRTTPASGDSGNAAAMPVMNTGTTPGLTFLQQVWGAGGTQAPGASSDGAIVDAVLWMGYPVNSTDPHGPLSNGAMDIQSIFIHEMAHTLGFIGPGSTADPTVGQWGAALGGDLSLYESLIEDQAGNSVVGGDNYLVSDPYYFNGTNAVAVYGDRVLLNQNSNQASHLGQPSGLMTHQSFRNYTFFNEVELAILKDLGYDSINLQDHFGKSYYQNAVTESNANGFNSTKIFGVGLHVAGNDSKITQTADLHADGLGGTGIRIDGDSNQVTVDQGVTVSANGDHGVGLLVSNGTNHRIVHRGTINADSTTSGAKGTGMLFSFGENVIGETGRSSAVADSEHTPGYLVDRVDVSGTISAGNGTGNVIHIDQTAAVREINLLNGVSLNGDIYSEAQTSTTEGLQRPTITFGHAAVDGVKQAGADQNFSLTYNGNIYGPQGLVQAQNLTSANAETVLEKAMNAEFVGGSNAAGTRLGGTTIFNETLIGEFGNVTVNGSMIAREIDNQGHLYANSSGRIAALEGILNSGIIDGDKGRFFSQADIVTLNGGRLQGTNTLKANQVEVQAGGTIAPGGDASNPIGTMTIDGDLLINGNGEFDLAADPLAVQDSDRIVVQNGTASINNSGVFADRGTFAFTVDDPLSADAQQIARRFTVISTENDGDLVVTARPAVSDNIDDRRIILRSDKDLSGLYTSGAKDYYAYVGRDVPFVDLAVRQNEVALAEYLDAIKYFDDGSPEAENVQWLRDTLDLIPNESGVREALGQLTGERYASVSPALNHLVYQNNSRMAATFRSEPGACMLVDDLTQGAGLYGSVSGFGLGGSVQGDRQSGGYNIGAAGTQVQLGFGDTGMQVGAYYNFTDGSMRGNGKVNFDMHEVGGFLVLKEELSHFMIMAGGGLAGINGSRSLNFGNTDIQDPISQRYGSDDQAGMFSARTEYGLNLMSGPVALRPFIGLAYNKIGSFRLREGDEAYGLNGKIRSMDSFRSELGSDLSFCLPNSPGTAFDLRGAWIHEFQKHRSGMVNASLAGVPTESLRTKGVDLGADFAQVGGTLSHQFWGGSVRVYGGYDFMFNNRHGIHTGTGGLEFLW